MNKKITTCYDKNETMRMLVKQDFLDFFGNEEIRKQIYDVIAARPYQCTVDAAMDMFMLGTIYGKRMERARRKKLEKNTLKESIISQIGQINSLSSLKMTYGFVKSISEEEMGVEK